MVAELVLHTFSAGFGVHPQGYGKKNSLPFGQGAGKYPTGHALATDVIDIVNGASEVPKKGLDVSVDNGEKERKYYVRTKASLPSEFVCCMESVDSYNYIITNKMKVSAMHSLANTILESDPCAFFAGIEE